MVEFIMTVGIPGSGKSTYVNKLKNKEYTVYSSDDLRESDAFADNNELFSFIHKNILDNLRKGKNCVMDATNLGRKKRANFLKDVKKTGAKCICELFVTPVYVCKENNRKRANNHGVTDEVIDVIVKRFECPWYADGFDEINVHAYSPEVSDNKMLGYNHNDLYMFEQDNPHHTMTVGLHAEKAEEYILENRILTENYPFLLNAQPEDLKI